MYWKKLDLMDSKLLEQLQTKADLLRMVKQEKRAQWEIETPNW